MRGIISGYDAGSGEIIIKLSTLKDNDYLPIEKEVEITVVESVKKKTKKNKKN